MTPRSNKRWADLRKIGSVVAAVLGSGVLVYACGFGRWTESHVVRPYIEQVHDSLSVTDRQCMQSMNKKLDITIDMLEKIVPEDTIEVAIRRHNRQW